MNIHVLYRLFGRYFRSRRMRQFEQAFSVNSQTRILDVGGTPYNWTLLKQKPRLTILNISLPIQLDPEIHWVIGDGTQLPFADGTFPVIYSNSVIEHLGTLERQQAYAVECRRVGQTYYIQTPNKAFPIEPHYLGVFIHWLPRHWRVYLLRYFTLWGWLTRPSLQTCRNSVAEIRLLQECEVNHLFPDAKIWHEKVLGMKKSLVAVKM